MDTEQIGLDNKYKIFFKTFVDFMNETGQDDLKKRLKLAQKFGLDLMDDEVLRLLTATPLPDIDEESVSIQNMAVAQNYPVIVTEPKKPTKIYGKNWIVLQNRLLNAISDLNLNERRLIMFLSPLVRKAIDINPTQHTFVVKVQEFMLDYGIKNKNSYKELSDSCLSLTNKSYIFWDFYKNQKKQSKTQVSWITKSVYQTSLGEVHVDLHNDVIEMLTIFDKSNPFTKYERQVIVNLGSYGIILFELIASCMYQKHKEKLYSIEYLREKFNCVDSYPKIADFKDRVINKAIKDIEKNTSYRITYTQKKKGRFISDIVFSFKNTEDAKSIKNKESGSNKIAKETKQTWRKNGLTDAQIRKIQIYLKEFVDANSGKISSNDQRDYLPIFEGWIPLLKDPKEVQLFKLIQEILDRQK